jgi:hypothetical protein
MWSRRFLLKFASAAVPLHIARQLLHAEEQGPESTVRGGKVTDTFPAQPAELVREMVTVAHFNEKRVRELVEARPSLARAAHDWGFGDWETALGAASHMGNRGIAEYLISCGARPTLFSAAMLGQLDVVKAFLVAQPGAHRIRGPHSISLLAHARMGGASARPVLELLESLGDVEDKPVPLSPEEAASLTGTFEFGRSPDQTVEVDADMKPYLNSRMYSYSPQLNWTRKGTTSRPLFYLGERVFYPAGAHSVRIRFIQEAKVLVMTVNDPDVVLTAHRRRT